MRGLRWRVLSRGRCCSLALVALLAVPVGAACQQRGADPLRIGVVLSGGSAKGFAHIGVLRVLEELGVPVHAVTGTSMGSLVGGLYASGYSPAELERITAELDWEALFTDATDRGLMSPDSRAASSRAVLAFPIRDGQVGLPSGVVRGERITRLLQRLTWAVQPIDDFRRLPIPFAAVATDLETGEAVVLRSGTLARAIRASIALPGVIQPVRIEGRLLVDGGIARNLPAQDALDLGANFLICSDVADPLAEADNLGSLVDVLLQTVTFQMEASSEEQRKLCDVLIRPDIDGLSWMAFDAASEWAQRGADAARASQDMLAPLARGRAPRAPDPLRALADSVRITEVRVRGLGPEAEGIALHILALPDSGWIDARVLDGALARLYASSLFGQAVYRVEPGPGGATVEFEVAEQTRDRLGFGFRYDDHRKASLLFTAALHNLFHYGSSLHMDLRLGEQLQVGARYLRGRGVTSRFSLGGDAGYTRALFDVYDAESQVARLEANVTQLSGFMGTALSRTTLAGVQLGLEHADAGTAISAADTTQTETFYALAGLLWRDTFDRAVYPTRGVSLLLKTEWADRAIGSGATFRQHLVQVEQILPLRGSAVLRLAGVAGAATGADLPVHRLFFLGGAYPSSVFPETQPAFWGLEPQERAGRAVQMLRASVQYETPRRIVLTAGLNTGNTFSEWTWDPEEYLVGYGLAAGATTPIGPLELTLTGRTVVEWPDLALNLGFRF